MSNLKVLEFSVHYVPMVRLTCTIDHCLSCSCTLRKIKIKLTMHVVSCNIMLEKLRNFAQMTFHMLLEVRCRM